MPVIGEGKRKAYGEKYDKVRIYGGIDEWKVGGGREEKKTMRDGRLGHVEEGGKKEGNDLKI